MKKNVMIAVLLPAFIYVAICCFLYVKQRDMMYFPAGPREDIAAITANLPTVIHSSPDAHIDFESWYWPPTKEDMPIVVFFHGNGQVYPWWVQKLMYFYDQGYGAYLIEYRGYGSNSGTPTEIGLYEDARAQIEALLRDNPDLSVKGLVFLGESLGTGVAVQMATEFQPKALILEAAFSSTSDVAKSRYGIFPIDWLMKDQFRSADKLGDLEIPKLFIHGKQDRIIPMRFGRKLYEEAAEPKQWVNILGAGHNNLFSNGAPIHIDDFLQSLESTNNVEAKTDDK